MSLSNLKPTGLRPKSPTLALVLYLPCLVFAMANYGFAQTETATLSGWVTDQNKSLLPDVELVAQNIDTNYASTVKTNSVGLYIISNLRPGRYRLSATKRGFQSFVRDVELHVQDKVIVNLSLRVESIAASVTITSETRSIDTSPSLGTVIDRQFVGNLPLNGRSFQSLLELSPGVVLTKADSDSPGQISVNGQRANSNYFTVDGVSANISVSAEISPNQYASGSLPGFSTFGGVSNLVSIEALQEFRVQTSGYAPEFGRVPGGQVSVVTRSGTNQFHGGVFNYFRNDVLDANDWFANSRALKRAALRQNDFGGVLGGPVVKNRTFFFFSYEGLRLRQPQTRLVTVPSVAARRNAPVTIKPFLEAFPIPNGTTFASGFAEFSGSYSDPSTLDATSLRIDQMLAAPLSIFGRFDYSPSGSKLRRSALSSVTTSRFSSETLTLGATWAITTTTSDEFRTNWSRTKGASFTNNDNFGGAVPPPESLLFPASTSRRDSFFTLMLDGGSNSSIPVGENAHNIQRQINLVNNISMIRRAHQIKFGIDYRRLEPTFNPRKYDQEVTFNGLSGALSAVAANVFIQTQYSAPTLLFTNLSVFAQDTWRTTPRLTMTYGVRWEHNPAPSEKSGNNPFTISGLSDPATMSLAPKNTRLWKDTWVDFAPRFGVAYELFRKKGRETVIRGGVGMFYDLGNGLAANSAGFGIFPFSSVKMLFDVPFPLSASLAAPLPFSLSPPYGFLFVYEPNHKLPISYQWNIATEQSLGSKQTISASYLGAAGRRLLRQELLIQPNPSFDVVFVTRNAATSDYHAFQLQFRRSLLQYLQVLASYTWSKSIDTNSNESSFFNVPLTLIDLNRERGPSDFDVRHSVTAAISYDLPAPKWSSIVRAAFSDWSLDAIIRARSGTPVNIVTGTNFLFGLFDVRPNLNPGTPLYLKDTSVAGGRRINSAAFSLPPDGQQGTLDRNALRGFGLAQLDLSVRRAIKLSERTRLDLKVEAFNVLNHPNFGNPVNDLSSNLFGQSIQMLGRSLGSGGFAGGLNPIYQIGGPRSIQLSLKIHF